MNTVLRVSSVWLVTALLLFTLGSANAALVNYVITGDVLVGDETLPNDFGLTAGDTIMATGIFDDSVLSSGSGSIDFSSGSVNTMTINVGTVTFTAANDTDFGTGGGPSITLSSLLLTDFDFQAFAGTNGAVSDFNSSFEFFDDFDTMLGEWRTGITAVPVPAAVWLFGSGLLGLAGIARKSKKV